MAFLGQHHQSELSDNATLMDEIVRFIEKNEIQINNESRANLQLYGTNPHRFISELIDAYFTPNDSNNLCLSHRTAEILLFQFIHNYDLNTDNVVKMSEYILTILDKDDKVNVGEITGILMKNGISGTTFAEGEEEYMKCGKFQKLFKSMDHWKTSNKLLRALWKQMNKWEPMEEVTHSENLKLEKQESLILPPPDVLQINTSLISTRKRNQSSIFSDRSPVVTVECMLKVHKCPSCKRIRNALDVYDRMGVGAVFDDQYSSRNLRDDYHHLCTCHCNEQDDADQFEDIYQFMIGKKAEMECDITHCPSAAAYYSRRRENVSMPQPDHREAFLQQIHCFLLHSYDLNRLTKSESLEIESELKEAIDDEMEDVQNLREQLQSEKLQRKRGRTEEYIGPTFSPKFVTMINYDRLESDDQKESDDRKENNDRKIGARAKALSVHENIGLDHRKSLKAFCNITGQSEEVGIYWLLTAEWKLFIAVQLFYEYSGVYIPAEQDPVSDNSGGEDDVYTVGHRFWYWDRDNMPKGAVRVEQKSSNLKEEVVGTFMDMKSWYNMVHECKDILNTVEVRKLVANGYDTKIYPIPLNSQIDMNHILSLKLYTDNTVLNRDFCEHFRAQPVNEKSNIMESVESLATRNSKYFNMAKNLQEFVQCFGMNMDPQKSYFRGVNKQFIFPKLVGRFYVPLSTTTSRSVAATFAGGGVTMALKRLCYPVKCLDTQLFSAMADEKEFLFFGGDATLQIFSIYKQNGIYRYELEALKLIQTLRTGSRMTQSISSKVQNISFKMLKCALNGTVTNDFDDYLSKLLMHQIEYTPTVVVYDWNLLLTKFEFLHEIIVQRHRRLNREQNQRILHISNLCNIFPNSKRIVIDMPSGLMFTEQNVTSIVNDFVDVHRPLELRLQWPDDDQAVVTLAGNQTLFDAHSGQIQCSQITLKLRISSTSAAKEESYRVSNAAAFRGSAVSSIPSHPSYIVQTSTEQSYENWHRTPTAPDGDVVQRNQKSYKGIVKFASMEMDPAEIADNANVLNIIDDLTKSQKIEDELNGFDIFDDSAKSNNVDHDVADVADQSMEIQQFELFDQYFSWNRLNDFNRIVTQWLIHLAVVFLFAANLTTDILVLDVWISNGKWLYFWISWCVIAMTHLAYMILNYIKFRDTENRDVRRYLVDLILTPIYPLLLYHEMFMAERSWNDQYSGLVLQSIFESFPQFILQSIALANDNGRLTTKVLLTVSLFCSMCSGVSFILFAYLGDGDQELWKCCVERRKRKREIAWNGVEQEMVKYQATPRDVPEDDLSDNENEPRKMRMKVTSPIFKERSFDVYD